MCCVKAPKGHHKKRKKATITLFWDLTVSAQQDILYCGVKNEAHILQKALFGEKDAFKK